MLAPCLALYEQISLPVAGLCTVTFFPVTFFPTCPLFHFFLSLYSYCYPNELLPFFLFLFSHLSTVTFFPVTFFRTWNCYFLSCFFFSHLSTVTFFPVTFFPVTFFPTWNCYFLSCYLFSCYFLSVHHPSHYTSLFWVTSFVMMHLDLHKKCKCSASHSPKNQTIYPSRRSDILDYLVQCLAVILWQYWCFTGALCLSSVFNRCNIGTLCRDIDAANELHRNRSTVVVYTNRRCHNDPPDMAPALIWCRSHFWWWIILTHCDSVNDPVDSCATHTRNSYQSDIVPIKFVD